MSNNITFSTEDIGGGVQLNRAKIVLGNNGTDDGDVSATNPMPVELVSPNPVPVEGTVTLDGPVEVEGTVTLDGPANTIRTNVVNVSSAAYTVDGNSGDIDVSGYKQLMIGIRYTAKSGAGDLVFTFQWKGPDGIYYDNGNIISGGISDYTKVVGPGTAPTSGNHCFTTLFPSTVRLAWDLQGPSSVTFSYWIIGIKG